MPSRALLKGSQRLVLRLLRPLTKSSHLVVGPAQDAYLPQRLVDKLMYLFNYIEMARVTGVPMSFLLTRGQAIKVFSQILRKARQKGLVVPNIRVRTRVLPLLSFSSTCCSLQLPSYWPSNHLPEANVAAVSYSSIRRGYFAAHCS